MLTLITVIHLLLAVILIGLVLMQDAKGGGAFGMGAGGGSSQSLFGSTGAANFLVRGTRWIAVLFAGTCIFLSYLTVQKDESVIEGFVPPAVEGAPAAAAPQADPAAAAPTENTETAPPAGE